MANEKKENKSKGIDVVWGSPDGLPVIYANQLQLSHGTGSEFHLFFGHLTPPLTHGITEDKYPEQIEIKPVAKIVISPEVLKNMVEVISGNIEEFEKKKSESGK